MTPAPRRRRDFLLLVLALTLIALAAAGIARTLASPAPAAAPVPAAPAFTPPAPDAPAAQQPPRHPARITPRPAPPRAAAPRIAVVRYTPPPAPVIFTAPAPHRRRGTAVTITRKEPDMTTATDTDPMPYADDAEGMQRWHHRHGLPWGRKYLGPDPVVIRLMVPAGTSRLSLSVHLANEHGIDDRMTLHGAEVEHMHAHLTGQFRDGQGHYHRQETR